MIVNEKQVTDAMKFWETQHTREHGPSDGIAIPKTVSKLADLLGAMWYSKEKQADIPDASQVALLIAQAHTEESAGDSSGATQSIDGARG